MITYVPMQCAGALRRVYPGFVQLTAFVSMNLQRHVKAHVDLVESSRQGRDGEGRDHQDLLRRIFCRDGSAARTSTSRPSATCSRNTCCRRAS